MRPADFICVCGECLVSLEIKLHLLIGEHLPEYCPLVYQVSQHEQSFAHFNERPIQLDPVLNPADELLIAVLTRLECHLIGLVFVEFAYVDDFDLHG